MLLLVAGITASLSRASTLLRLPFAGSGHAEPLLPAHLLFCWFELQLHIADSTPTYAASVCISPKQLSLLSHSVSFCFVPELCQELSF